MANPANVNQGFGGMTTGPPATNVIGILQKCGVAMVMTSDEAKTTFTMEFCIDSANQVNLVQSHHASCSKLMEVGNNTVQFLATNDQTNPSLKPFSDTAQFPSSDFERKGFFQQNMRNEARQTVVIIKHTDITKSSVFEMKKKLFY